jgi:hypothetical protein
VGGLADVSSVVKDAIDGAALDRLGDGEAETVAGRLAKALGVDPTELFRALPERQSKK